MRAGLVHGFRAAGQACLLAAIGCAGAALFQVALGLLADDADPQGIGDFQLKLADIAETMKWFTEPLGLALSISVALALAIALGTMTPIVAFLGFGFVATSVAVGRIEHVSGKIEAAIGNKLKATAPCSQARLDAIFFHVPDPGGLRTQLAWPEPAQPEDAAAGKAGNPSRRKILSGLARKQAETNAELRDAAKARDGLEEATAEALAKLIAGLETTQWNPEAAAPDRA